MEAMRIDLNLDAGESAEALTDGSEVRLYSLVSSLNVACGGHAGDEFTMETVVNMAASRGLAVGAHPSFPDRKSFGRRPLKMPHAQLVDSLCEQIESLSVVLRKNAMQLSHVKPHGALYNLAATNREYASAVIEAVRRIDRRILLVGLAGSQFIKWCNKADQPVIGEGFVDRLYEADGTLRDRQYADALITDPVVACDQALHLTLSGSAQTLCVHGDAPRALIIATAVREHLIAAGVKIRAIERRPHG
jgi:5-oxoprolinase (ATP-hydrolysing) subunit A